MTNNFTKRNVDAELLATWHGGELEFDGLTFAEIAKALERQYNVQIILEKGIDNNKKLVGSLSYEKDIHEMMRAIASVISIRYDIQINTIVHIYSQH
jgi:ferric-dicitrate binding protein FerR (iron transport regulator)